MHWAQSTRGWFGAFATLPHGRALLRRELTFLHTSPEDAAEQITRACADWKIELRYTVLDPKQFPATNEPGETVSETFSRNGVGVRRGSTDRLASWSRLRSWLRVRDWPDGVRGPSLLIHLDCRVFLRLLPTLIEDPTDRDDVLVTTDEYPARAASYFVMSRPLPQRDIVEPFPKGSLGYEVEEMRRAAALDV
jgi:hypothetical protein